MAKPLDTIDRIVLELGTLFETASELAGAALVMTDRPTLGTFLLIAGIGLDLTQTTAYSSDPIDSMPYLTRLKYSLPHYRAVRHFHNRYDQMIQRLASYPAPHDDG